jgi:hypothetical protein
MGIVKTRARRRWLEALTSTVLLALLGALLLAGTASAAAKPGKPTAKAPQGAISTAKPTFTWGKAARATKYEVRVYRGSAQVLKQAGLKKLSWTSSTALPANVDLTWKVRAGNARGTGAWSSSRAFKVTIAPALKIGDVYQGGKVAYILKSGDPGYVAGQTHGLIAASADQSTAASWSNNWYALVGGTGTAIRTGQANTTAVVAQAGCTSGAAWLCDQLTEAGYSDWYLPSRDDMYKLYLNRVAIGGFGSQGTVVYWSSSEASADRAYIMDFMRADMQTSGPKLWGCRVRAVRSF